MVLVTVAHVAVNRQDLGNDFSSVYRSTVAWFKFRSHFWVSFFPSLCTFRMLRTLLRKYHIFSWGTFILLLKGKHYTSFDASRLFVLGLCSDDPILMNSPFHGCNSHPNIFTSTTVYMLLALPLFISHLWSFFLSSIPVRLVLIMKGSPMLSFFRS